MHQTLDAYALSASGSGSMLVRERPDREDPDPPRLVDAVRDRIRVRHLSPSTEKAYPGWIARFVRANPGRHPRELGKSEIETFLTDLAVRRNVSASTQKRGNSPELGAGGVVIRRGPLVRCCVLQPHIQRRC